MAPYLVLQFYVRFLSFCWEYVLLNCRLSPMKNIRELVAGGALYLAFGVVNGGDGGGNFFGAAVLCPLPLFLVGICCIGL